MIFFVSVRTRAKRASVEGADATHYRIAVREAPERGWANEAVCRALARHLGIAPSRCMVMSGHTASKKKILCG